MLTDSFSDDVVIELLHTVYVYLVAVDACNEIPSSLLTCLASIMEHDANYNEYASLHIYTDGSFDMSTTARLNRVAGWGVAMYMIHTSNSTDDDAIT